MPGVDELVSERLQVFLSGQARPETSVSVALDGAAIVLYEDGGAQVSGILQLSYIGMFMISILRHSYELRYVAI